MTDSLIEKLKERCDLSEKDPWVYLDDVEEIIRQHQAAMPYGGANMGRCYAGAAAHHTTTKGRCMTQEVEEADECRQALEEWLKIRTSYQNLQTAFEGGWKAAKATKQESSTPDQQLLRDMGKLREALVYAVWQHEGRGTPEHDHWSAKAIETLSSTGRYAELIKRAGELAGKEKP